MVCMYVCRVVEHVTLVFCLGLRSSKQGGGKEEQGRAKNAECGKCTLKSKVPGEGALEMSSPLATLKRPVD